MLTAIRKLQGLCNPQRLAVSVFVSIVLFMYLAAVLGNDMDWRQQRPSAKTTQDWQSKINSGRPSLQSIQEDADHQQSQMAENLPNASFMDDAHNLTSPDDFQSHFEAVMTLRGVSFSEAKKTCTWYDLSKINFQFEDGENSWTLNTSWTVRQWPQEELEAARKGWQQFIRRDLMPWKDHAHKFSGRGIVIVAGSGHSLKRVSVTLKKLKKLGSKLPIELHYWGNEMNEAKKKILTDLWPSMTFNDLSSSDNIFATTYDTEPNHPVHYNLKTAALINTHFAEPLLLDDDNIPAIAPDSLWDSHVYKEYGTIFWPDLARTRPDNPVWSITNTPCRMDEYEQESGQLLVDKRRFFYHLQLAAWMNSPKTDDNGKYVEESYYNNFLLGDKDTFRFAWHALKTDYGKPFKWITSVGTLTSSGDYCGHSSLQHHPDGRPLFMHAGLLKIIRKPAMEYQRENGGVFRAYKQSQDDEQHDKNVQVDLRGDGMQGLCVNFPEVEMKPLEELVPGFEKEFDEYGGYWPLDEADNAG